MLDGDLSWAACIRRTGRFTVLADLRGEEVLCFNTNPGRIEEVLVPGNKLLLRKAARSPPAKTGYDLIGAEMSGHAITIDSRFASVLMREAIESGALPEFEGYRFVRTEPPFGSGRFDLLLDPPCLIEVKSCTLVRDGVAIFPDAPTKRGTRHLRELVEARKKGYRACAVFVVQRDDCHAFGPNREIDPDFGRALDQACRSGVEALVYTASCRGRELSIRRRIDLVL